MRDTSRLHVFLNIFLVYVLGTEYQRLLGKQRSASVTGVSTGLLISMLQVYECGLWVFSFPLLINHLCEILPVCLDDFGLRT